jgi:hypothetical protein
MITKARIDALAAQIAWIDFEAKMDFDTASSIEPLVGHLDTDELGAVIDRAKAIARERGMRFR